MKRLLYICFLLFTTFCSLSAQLLEPVQWKANAVQESDSLVRLELMATIEPGWHLYATSLPEDGPKPTAFFLQTEDKQLHPLLMSADKQPIRQYDENFMMDLEYYTESVLFSAYIPLSSAHELQGTIEFMACNDQMCLPPTEFDWSVSVQHNNTTAATADSHGLLWLFLMGLLGGLLAIFTPCVWPVIPMTVSFFMKRNEKGKPVKEAILYGASIVLIYVGLGLLVTIAFGASALNDIATNAVVNIFFFLLLLLFAISFFGAFELTLPASWSTRLDAKARNTSGILSILLMAFTLVIVSFSCTGPIIGTLLVEAAGKSLMAPTVGMLGFALALAIPFSVFALFPNWLKNLPKSGSWMNTFKVTLAFLELALSLKFFSVADLAYGWHLLDREVFLALWIVIFALLGFYLLGWFHFRNEDKPQGISVFRMFLAMASLAFSLYMLPGLWGAPLKAISAFAPPMTTQDWKMDNKQVSDNTFPVTDIDEALEKAAKENKRVLLDFSGYGCVNCRKMEAKVLSDERVQKSMQRYVLVTLIVDDKTRLAEPIEVEENGRKRWLKTVGDRWSYVQRTQYGANAQPYYVILTPNGERIGDPYSYNEDIQKFIDWLEQ